MLIIAYVFIHINKKLEHNFITFKRYYIDIPTKQP